MTLLQIRDYFKTLYPTCFHELNVDTKQVFVNSQEVIWLRESTQSSLDRVDHSITVSSTKRTVV